MVVLKLDKNGAYQWHTYYPTSATRLAVDASSNVLLGGSDSAAWLDGYKDTCWSNFYVYENP